MLACCGRARRAVPKEKYFFICVGSFDWVLSPDAGEVSLLYAIYARGGLQVNGTVRCAFQPLEIVARSLILALHRLISADAPNPGGIQIATCLDDRQHVYHPSSTSGGVKIENDCNGVLLTALS